SGLDNLHIAGLFPYNTPLAVGVRSDWPELRNLVQKAYDSFPEGRMNEIIRHWVQVTAEPEVSHTVLLRAALMMLLLIAVFLMFYSRLRRANRALAKEVVQRRKAEEATLRLNDELLSKNQQLETLSRTDALTGLKNRYHIENALEDAVIHCLSRQHSLSIMLLDMDHFKSINDRFGHNIGDQALKAFAEVLKPFIYDGLLAGRWGGEEFLLILPETDLEQAFSVGKKI
ncbi:GGDEF domain-containing protein, partial [Oceanospirillum sp. HFRX-1_2]